MRARARATLLFKMPYVLPPDSYVLWLHRWMTTMMTMKALAHGAGPQRGAAA